MRHAALALLALGAFALSGCLAATAVGTVAGVTAKTAGAAVHAGGMVAGAIVH